MEGHLSRVIRALARIIVVLSFCAASRRGVRERRNLFCIRTVRAGCYPYLRGGFDRAGVAARQARAQNLTTLEENDFYGVISDLVPGD